MKITLTAKVLLVAIGLSGVINRAGAEQRDRRPTPRERLMDRIRKQLVTLPYYGVFDNLAFELERDTVTLYGQVVRPTTKKDAEDRVSRIEGVERVINRIEVLPLSPSDDRTRQRTYRAVFSTGGLHRYSLGANPSIHIVVNRGHVTLEGVVSNRMDRQLAYFAANGVP
ncbi:MAG TPA: BON domain-containing protein, partial [Blastocatellia bacterium]|nr:BON domain-containing protein [Blastocatellia bacterium]